MSGYFGTDFMIEEDYIEIKGFRYPNTKEKINQFPKEKKLIMIEGKKEIKPYLDYVEEKYGKEFWKVLYECGSAVDGSRAD